jgi:hypothetical protein
MDASNENKKERTWNGTVEADNHIAVDTESERFSPSSTCSWFYRFLEQT